MASSDEYDEFDARVRVPKGETLAKSRRSPDGYRGFVHGADRKMQHAEIFLKDEREQDDDDLDEATSSDDSNTTYLYIVNDDATSTREQQERDELLAALVLIALIKAARVVSPHVIGWWHGRALPFIAARWARLQRRRRVASQVPPGEPGTVLEPDLSDSEEVEALREYEVSMTSEEARNHLVDALVAKRFVDEKMRLLANAKIADGALPVELADAVRGLTPEQVQLSLASILAANPHVLTDLEQLFRSDRRDRRLELGSDKIREALRLTDPQD